MEVSSNGNIFVYQYRLKTFMTVSNYNASMKKQLYFFIRSECFVFFLYPEKLSGRDDVTRNKIIFRPDIRQNFLKKKIEHQEFMRLLKQLGAM